LTAITYSDETLFEAVATLLKRTISDSQSNHVKAIAIYCLGICITFGGAGEEEIAENMTFLLEVTSSDGAFINAEDNAEVVTASLRTYGFLATQIEDLEDESEDAITTFLDQLDSDDTGVQIAAGENIALLYEKSYTAAEEDDTASDIGDHEDGSSSSDETAGDSSLIKRYNAYHNTNEVMEKVTALSSLSSKGMNKRDKKQLHQTFASITMTVQNPRLGLLTNNASKMTVRIHQTGEMRVDKWWKLMRLNAIRRLLAGGFVNHYFEGNKQVLDTLPLIMRETGEEGMKSPRRLPPSKSSKGRYRDSRRFVSGELGELA
jgi:Interferon-related developmental regulator (IFRD)